MKALVLAMTPKSQWTMTYNEITHGKAGHDLEGLKNRLARAGKVFPQEVATSFRNALSWSTSLRYQVRWISPSEVQRFLDASANVVRWVGRSHSWLG